METELSPEMKEHVESQRGEACPAPVCSLSALVSEWQIKVARKWKEVRDSKGHFISVYSPQWGHAEDLRRRRETSMEVMRWTVQWFKDRGHAVECEIMADGESIGIREANDQMEQPPGSGNPTTQKQN